MRRLAPLLLLLACEDGEPILDTGRFADAAWDDGAAVVSVYRGRWKRYGAWREAEIREYLVREYLDPAELTKRDTVTPGLVPVLKANRHVTFSTGTYDYRLMHSLFFHRRTGRLVKGVGSSQEGCGLVFQRWHGGTLHFDSYWEGEGRGERPLPKDDRAFFEDELPFVAASLPDGTTIEILPSLMANKLGDRRTATARVQRAGATVRVGKAVFEYDAAGLLERWRVPDRQEFARVAKSRMYYWNYTDPGDERRLAK